MKWYPMTTDFKGHDEFSAAELYDALKFRCTDSALKSILNIDLSFIDYNALPSDEFILERVVHIGSNLYSLHYDINYHIFNLCKDMNLKDFFKTTINFEVYENYLCFDVIDSARDPVEEF
ncbi:hypothetical protein MUA04_03340 [Enterobacteriaceae bacterium H11S18]|uniref:hypothetical protein n=1 Tax=Dryocola clanedunensis TaxID=2925396 RepID=UPI0022F0A2AE|nr:hypothetical protein [Dryocola clanedunensis]MCT4709228.1 hypothetical protein [Dryocola clanedunensis]